MTDPITPTRIIPADAPLPSLAPAPAPAAPPPPPPPPLFPSVAVPGGEWWRPPTPDPLATVPQPPIEVSLKATLVFDPEPELTWRDRLRAMVARLLRPLWTWRGAVALVLAVAPIPGVGESAATIWHYTVSEAREMSIGTGYAVGLVPLAFAGWALTRVGPTAPRLWLLAVSTIGALGAMSWYDIVQLFTGVAR